MLFDEFWREGELALFFGAPGTGKGILGIQLAEALARGRGLDGFRTPRVRRKVLYVDLTLTNKQFQARYSHHTPDSNLFTTYKFSERLYRDRPPARDELVDWVCSMVTDHAFQVVVIDDLSAFKRTHDGTLDTLRIMRDLRQLRDELNISILVLTDSAEPRRGFVSEADLGRSRVLCSVADSVFAICRYPHGAYFVQTRSRNSAIGWTVHNAPTGRITRLETGLLGFKFDERFSPRMDEEAKRLIRRVYSMREGGATYREIAEELGISKSRAAVLFKKWTPTIGEEPPASAGGFTAFDQESPALESPTTTDSQEGGFTPASEFASTGGGKPPFRTVSDRVEPEEWNEAGFEKPDWLEGIDDDAVCHPTFEILSTTDSQMPATEHGPHACPFLYDASPEAEAWFLHLVRTHPERTDDSILRDYAAAEPWCRPPGAAPPYDPNDPFASMEATIDDHDNQIFVEERTETGKPRVWYSYRSDGRLMRRVHDGHGCSGKPANPNLFGRFTKIKPKKRARPSCASAHVPVAAFGF
jgi:KaiC/GvpD/RAD55 family RecA-like ATPase